MNQKLLSAAIAAGLVAVAAVVAPFVSPAKSAGLFQCESSFRFSDPRDKASIAAIAHNRTMKVIVKEYAQRWDAQEIRNFCDAHVAGRSYESGCFDGRRDWTAIRAMIPSELFKLDRKALRPHQLKIQSEVVNPRSDAIEYCQRIGAMSKNRTLK